MKFQQKSLGRCSRMAGTTASDHDHKRLWQRQCAQLLPGDETAL